MDNPAHSTHSRAASRLETIDVPVLGMDCGGCVKNVRGAITGLPGVVSVEVFLAGERAAVTLDPAKANVQAVRKAVQEAGYTCPAPQRNTPVNESADVARAAALSRSAMTLMGLVFGVVLFTVIVGEWLGLFGVLTERVPLWAGALLVLAFGFPVFRNVVRNALRGRVVSHTLMSTGAFAALAIGEWATAALVVFFMRVGDYAESFTTERARRSLRDLTALVPRTARIERNGGEVKLAVEQVRVGDIVVIRPGEAIPVDGEVVGGSATVNQAAITGESMPVEASPGTRVFAATIAQLGSLRVRALEVGLDTTFAKVVRQVEEAEANRGETQRLADAFSAWYLPIVAAIALATYLLRGDLLAAVAVTVVACSCAFALATPVAMLASIGAAAKRGLLIKGGKYIEALAKADVLLLDKTGTLTVGEPKLVDVVPLGARGEDELLALAAAAERDSEHPLARAVLRAARDRGLEISRPDAFEALPGYGVRARVRGHLIEVGSQRLLKREEVPAQALDLEAQGKTLLFVLAGGKVIGILAAADTLRAEVPAAVAAIREFGICQIELLTGDNERVAQAIAGELGIAYRANLLPEDKIEAVKSYQARGQTVVMIGDGVNDAPALVQADVGVAMGAAGTDIAIEAAHVALMNDDWSRIPELFALARRTMSVVKLNIGFTAVYNLVGITLAALGFLPPIFAAALQSIPDLGIMGNSARLLRTDARPTPEADPVVPGKVLIQQ
ncbi:MAG: cation-translocating P-type ATPase [Trueperaceae bacterium]